MRDPDVVLARIYPDLSPVLLKVIDAEDLAALIRARYVRRYGETYVWTKLGHAKGGSTCHPATPSSASMDPGQGGGTRGARSFFGSRGSGVRRSPAG